ncbi:MAG: hypothetical protein ACE145_17120 [Terriglobia bacterium]
MSYPLSVAILAVVVGALETAGGAQELVVQGILNNRGWPLIAGTLGTVAGALLLFSGIALLRNSQQALRLAYATAWVSAPVFILIGVIDRITGIPVTAIGIALPLFLVAYLRKRHSGPNLAAASSKATGNG